jgi:hypothetical protein
MAMIRYVRRKHISTTEHGDTVLRAWLNGAAEALHIHGKSEADCERKLAARLRALNRAVAMDITVMEMEGGLYRIASHRMRYSRVVAAAELAAELAAIGQEWREMQEGGL